MTQWIHIHRPQCWMVRTVRYCSTCKRRRRFVVHLYEWYAPYWDCGGCGYRFCADSGRLRAGKRERAKRRQFVWETWPLLPGLSVAIEQMRSTWESGASAEF